MAPAEGRSVRVLSRRTVAPVAMKSSRQLQKSHKPVHKSECRTLRADLKVQVEQKKKSQKSAKRVIADKMAPLPVSKRQKRTIQAAIVPKDPEDKMIGKLAQSRKVTLLESKSISKESRVQYGLYLQRFKVFCQESGVRWPMPDMDADPLMADFMDVMFQDGRSAHEGEKTLAALEFEFVQLKGRMVRSRRALRGWRRVMPATSRLPLPRIMMHGLAMQLLAQGKRDMALMTLVMFNLYLRPGEAADLCKRHVVAPVKMAGNQYAWVTVIIRDQEHKKPDKIGVYDNSLPFDKSQDLWLGNQLLQHAQSVKSKDGKLFNFKMEEYRRAFVKAGVDLGVPGLHPYQMRHGGATEDLTSGRRDFNMVKIRGRWRTDQSVRRYSKVGRVQQLLNQLSVSSQRFCLWSEKNMEKVMLGMTPARSIVG